MCLFVTGEPESTPTRVEAAGYDRRYGVWVVEVCLGFLEEEEEEVLELLVETFRSFVFDFELVFFFLLFLPWLIKESPVVALYNSVLEKGLCISLPSLPEE